MNVIPLQLASDAAQRCKREDAKHTLGSPIDRPRESASLPREVELEVQIQQMLERLACDFANSGLADVGEYGVEQLAKERGSDASGAVCGSSAEVKSCAKIASDVATHIQGSGILL